MGLLAVAVAALAMLVGGISSAGTAPQGVTSLTTTIAPAADARPDFVASEVVVRFKPTVGKKARVAITRAEGATLKDELLLPGTVVLRLPRGEPVPAAVAKLERHPEVLYAEPNRLYDLSWERTTEQKHTGAWSVTDSPGTFYPSDNNSTLTRAFPLNLSGQDGCNVDYWLRLETEYDFDFLWLETSPDGVTWTPVSGWSGSTGGQFFELMDDLSSSDGLSNVHFRFRLESDEIIQDDGAHIDDVAFKCLQPGGDDYKAISGTSMASPHAAGVAALLLAQDSTRTPAQLKTRLTSGVDVLPQLSPYTIASGRLNACKALDPAPADCSAAVPLPNDPRVGELWGLNQPSDADIDAPEAWGLTTGSSNVIVAVIDSGVAYDNQDVAPNMWLNNDPANGIDDDGNGFVDDTQGWDFWEGDSTPIDENGHGTHVAGTIGAQGNNSLGVAGVNWDVSIMALRAGGPGPFLSEQAIVDSFMYACTNGARVVNGSFGSSFLSQAMADAVTAAACQNTLFVFSAGNDDLDLDFDDAYPCELHRPPVSASNVICIGATDHGDLKASFSNHGTSAVHLAAPGVGILSTWPAQRSVVPFEDFETDLAGRWVPGAISPPPPPPPPPPSPPPPPPPNMPACPPTDAVVGATYRGTHANGGAVCLTVTPGWTGVINFLINDVPGTPSCGFAWVHFRAPTPAPISNRSFTLGGLSGSFPTDRGAAGTLSFTSGGCSIGPVSWTATTDGTPPWAVPPAPPPPPRPPAVVRCVVPNVKGKTVARARLMLRSRRCALGRASRRYSGRVRRGKIITQSRRPGVRLARGTRVNVVVSRGKRRR
jgi:subtilisin family serine protease